MKILWMPEAKQDLKNIYSYIAADSPKSATNVILSLIDFIETLLGVFPKSGHEGRVLGTHEVVVPRLPYWIPYRIKDGTVEILRVYHTSRTWPDNFT